MPRVTSALLARHEAHVFDGLGAMETPHMQHRTFTMVPPPATPGGSIGSSMVAAAGGTSIVLWLWFGGFGGKSKGEMIGCAKCAPCKNKHESTATRQRT